MTATCNTVTCRAQQRSTAFLGCATETAHVCKAHLCNTAQASHVCEPIYCAGVQRGKRRQDPIRGPHQMAGSRARLGAQHFAVCRIPLP